MTIEPIAGWFDEWIITVYTNERVGEKIIFSLGVLVPVNEIWIKYYNV